MIVYVALVFLLTWGIAGMAIFAPALAERIFGPPGVTNPSFYIAVYVPSVVGILLTAVYEGKAGLRALFRRLDPSAGGGWVFVAILGLIALVGLGGGSLRSSAAPLRAGTWAPLPRSWPSGCSWTRAVWARSSVGEASLWPGSFAGRVRSPRAWCSA